MAAQDARAPPDLPRYELMSLADPTRSAGWMKALAGPHLDIAASDAAVNHILAGPGTGKTFSMMRRIRRWLESGVPPQRILAVTFTRTAALDLKDQLRRMGVAGAEEVHATTLHALAYSVLSRREVFDATGRSPRALFSYEVRQLVLDLKGDHGGIRAVKRLLLAFEAGWARLQRDPLGPPQDPSEAAFQTALLDWLRYHRSMLIGELVPLALAYARRNPALNVLPAYSHVLVDEYQDLNRADQELVVAFPRSDSLTVAGDPNQSIYRFRFAHPEGIITFPGEHPGCAEFSLTVCQRCPANLVRMATSLVNHNPPWARPLDFQPPAGREDASVYLVQHRTTDDEVETIADFVHAYLTAHADTPPGRVLILATRRFLGNGIRDALITRGRNALSFFFEDELKEVAAAEGLCLLNLLVTPDDRAALRAWLGIRRPSDGAAAPYRRIRMYSEQHESELRAVLDRMADGELTLPRCASAVERYRDLRARLAGLQGLTGTTLVDALWPTAEQGTSNIRVLAANLSVENPEPAALLDALRRNIMQPELPGSEGDVIRVMSLHKSKGLTADVCVVTGCVAGALPTIDEDDAAAEDAARYEQRRLLYVAITRPQKVLVLSSARLIPWRLAPVRLMIETFGSEGAYAVMQPSDFLDELGPECPAPITGDEWRDAAGFARKTRKTRKK